MEATTAENDQMKVDEKLTATTTTTTTSTTTTTPTIATKEKKKKSKKSTIELLNEQQEKFTLNQSNLSSFKTRGQKRATETYDFLFGNIRNTQKDIDTLYGYDLDGPSEQELIVYFNQFPKKTNGKIVLEDLTNYVKQTYNADEIKKIKVDDIFKSMDQDNVGEIIANDFAVYLSESIIEDSKSKGLIIEIEDEKPKKRSRATTKTTKTTTVVASTKASKKVDKTKEKEKAKKLKEKEKAKKLKLKLKEKEKSKKAKKSTTKKPKVRASKKKVVQSDDEEEEEASAEEIEMNTLEGGIVNTNTGEGGSKPMWQYEFTPGKYLDYTPEASAITELAYQDWLTNPYTDVRSVKSGQWCYQIDFKANTQTNIQHEDHTTRNIRRVLK